MKVLIAGGTGQLGNLLTSHFRSHGHDVVTLSRSGGNNPSQCAWDGRTLGAWAKEVDGSDVVINLAGRSVNCRYTKDNLKQMMDSRVDSTKVMGEAIAQATKPPRVWLQMSTATLYAHRFDAANTESSGVIGGNEPGVPAYWSYSIDIAKAWERALHEAQTPHTRRVALRTSMVMSPDRGGVFDVLLQMTRFGLGGAIAGGKQFVSWIHDHDFVRAIDFLINHEALEGAVNLASPNPLPQREFMSALREAWGTRIGLPAMAWMAEIGAFFLRTDTELLLKSRRVVPETLLKNGFEFQQPEWPQAARDLVQRWRASHK